MGVCRLAGAWPIELIERSQGSGDGGVLVRATTNRDGRTDEPLIPADDRCRSGLTNCALRSPLISPGRGVAPLAAPPFLDVVPIRFGIAEPEGHYHVPLVMTPWSYTTYRGS